MQDKLPLTNPLLQSLGAIHPETRGHSKTLSYMQKLPTYATTVLNEAETEEYDQEIRKFHIDNSLPEIEDTRIDHWWGKDEVVQKYPNLSKLVQALLSCFHGPQVESSFNVMNDVIDNKSGRLNLETYSAIQTIKYRLSADGKTAIQFFQKKDYMHETVDKMLCKNMSSSNMEYKADLDKKKDKKLLKQRELDIRVKNTQSKRKAKELIVHAAKKARLGHCQNIKK